MTASRLGSSSRARRRGIARAVAFAVVAAWAVAGCISVDVGGKKGEAAPEDRFHVLDAADTRENGAGGNGAGAKAAAPAQPASPQPSARRPVIAIRTLRCRDRFGKHVVRRDDAGRITPLDHDLWADEPAQAVTDAVREALATCGTFAAAVDASDAHEVDLFLDGTVLEFAITAPGTTTTAAKALFRARFTIAEAKSGRVLVAGSYAGDADVPGPAAAGLGVAMGRAVGQALRALLAEWQPVAGKMPGFHIGALDPGADPSSR